MASMRDLIGFASKRARILETCPCAGRLPEILGIAFEAAAYDSRVIESQALRKPDVLPPSLSPGRITETALPARACAPTRAVDGATRMGRKGGS
jgi:hypothetical protein